MPSTFSQIPSTSIEAMARNFRDLGDKTKSGTFTPTFEDVGGTPTGIGYFFLLGSLCYYLIEISPAAGQQLIVDWDTIGSSPKIHSLPYGPIAVPGTTSKVGGTTPTPQYAQVLDCWSAPTKTVVGGALIAGYPWAGLAYESGLPTIELPSQVAGGVTTLTADWKIYLSGWFIRN